MGSPALDSKGFERMSAEKPNPGDAGPQESPEEMIERMRASLEDYKAANEEAVAKTAEVFKEGMEDLRSGLEALERSLKDQRIRELEVENQKQAEEIVASGSNIERAVAVSQLGNPRLSMKKRPTANFIHISGQLIHIYFNHTGLSIQRSVLDTVHIFTTSYLRFG